MAERERALAALDESDLKRNDRSSIAFPYLDLETAVEVAKAVYERAGLSGCEIDELAAQMGQTVSGAFRLKIATARLFDLLAKEGRGTLKLSSLGQKVIASDTEAEGRASAFLTIPLYKSIFDRYRGHLLPPQKALEREMISLGVAPKQAGKARQAFERSAHQAGFFAQGDDRLVSPRFDREVGQPRIDAGELVDLIAKDDVPSSSGGGNGGLSPRDKPLEYHLIDLLKEGGIGDEERKAVWVLVQFLTGSRAKDTVA